jgi:hypothetical protein
MVFVTSIISSQGWIRPRDAAQQTEKLSAAEVARRLALSQLLWAESERGVVESVRTSAFAIVSGCFDK